MKTGMAGGIWSSGYLWSKTPGRLSSPWPPELLHGPPGALRFPLRLPSGLFSTTAVPRNSSPGSEEEDPTPVLGPRDPPESRRCPRSPSFSLTRPFPPLSVRLQPHRSPGRRLHLPRSLRSQGLCRGCFWEALLFFLRLGGCHLALGNKFKGHFLPFHSLLKMITSWIYDSHAT